MRIVAVSLFLLLAACGLGYVVMRSAPVPTVLFEGKPVSTWAEELNSPRSSVRDEASATVARFNSNAIPPLVRLLRTPDPFLARPVRILERWLPKRASRRLVQVVDPNAASLKRMSGAQALRTMGTNASAALPDLARALAVGSTVSWHSSLALSDLGQPGIAALTKALAPSAGLDETVVGYVCYALGRQGPSASNAIPAVGDVLERAHMRVAETAASALGDMGKLAVPRLIRALKNPDAKVRLLALRALGEIGPLARESVPKLLEIGKTDSPSVREAALLALARIQPTSDEVIEGLVRALRDPTRAVRLKAIQALSNSPRSAAPALTALVANLQDENPDVRSQAAALLGRMESPSEMVLSALRRILKDDNEAVRSSAAEALKRLGVPPSTPSRQGS